MTLTERDKVWIHRSWASNGLYLCAAWNGLWNDDKDKSNFSHEESKELFDLIKDAIQAKYPNITVNPWSNAEHGTLD